MGILLAAIDTGSLSAASRKLRIPLATVSRRMSELEAHLNVRLLADALHCVRIVNATCLPDACRTTKCHDDYIWTIRLRNSSGVVPISRWNMAMKADDVL